MNSVVDSAEVALATRKVARPAPVDYAINGAGRSVIDPFGRSWKSVIPFT